MKKLNYLLFSLLFIFIFCSKVNAYTYSTESNITATFNNTAYNRRNVTSGKTYYHGDTISSSTGFISETIIRVSDRSDHIDGIFAGTYLLDFYIFGSGSITENLSCDNINANFGYYDVTTGNLVSTSNKISTSCLEVYNSKYNTINAVKVLMQFTFNGDFAHDFRFQITNNAYFLNNTNLFGVFIGNIYDYNQQIVELFHQNALQDMQIIQNEKTNEKLDESIQTQEETNNTINNSNIDSPYNAIGSVSNSIASNGVITQLVTLPVTLFQNILNSVNGSCSSYNMGSLFGTDLILPCINVSNYIGAQLWSVIDVIISGLFVWSISRKMIKVFNNFSTLKDGDVLSD